jgi:hypothetical protein
MKTTALILALASIGLFGGGAAIAASGNAPTIGAATETHQSQTRETFAISARKKVRRDRQVQRGYRSTYGYYRPRQGYYGQGYYGRGYYRGVRPGWGYGPDPGDYAWPPFHFKPYY